MPFPQVEDVAMSFEVLLQIKWDMRSKTSNNAINSKTDSRNSASGTVPATVDPLPPAFGGAPHQSGQDLRRLMDQAVQGWLSKSPSAATRENYARDLRQFLDYRGIPRSHLESLATVLPTEVAAWRDHLRSQSAANSTIRRKLTALRSLFSYLQVYGYTGANPAHGKFVKAPAVPRDGKTVGLSPRDCRRLLEVADTNTPSGLRDRALLAVLAYSACRVGEVVQLSVGDFKTHGEHRVLQIYGKGGKERTVPLHLEAVERLADWLDLADIRADRKGPLFRPAQSPRGKGRDGFKRLPLSTRAVERLVRRYASNLQLDPGVTVHSLRVTALTTARERGADIIDLQDFAGHADPRTTLTYIRSRDRLSKSPAYVLNY
jgi:integrase/recombinase XerD